MARRSKKSPPAPVYHDGLIPTTPDTYHTYPEVVPADHDQVKHEKSYPELAPPQHQHQPTQSSPQPLSSSSSPPSATPAAAAAAAAAPTNPLMKSQPGAAAVGPMTPLPRPSGVHSLRQAWSEVDEDEHRRNARQRGKDDDDDGLSSVDGGDGLRRRRRHGRPVWKRSVFWVALVAVVVVGVLAGVLGGVASGRIRVAALGDGTQASGSIPSVENPTCPDADNRNYTSPVWTPAKTFRLRCYVTYNGDTGLLKQPNGTETMAACLDACARETYCVGATFKQRTPPECWLMERIGRAQGGQPEWTMSGVLWQ